MQGWCGSFSSTQIRIVLQLAEGLRRDHAGDLVELEAQQLQGLLGQVGLALQEALVDEHLPSLDPRVS